jgi:hypothetical protein
MCLAERKPYQQFNLQSAIFLAFETIIIVFFESFVCF